MISIPVDTWNNYKNLVINTKGLLIQYAEYSDYYEIFASEEQFIWRIVILKDSGSDQIDFETNYKSSANKPLTPAFSTPTNTRPVISNTTSVLVAANPNRKYLSIFNQNNKNVYIKFGANAVLNQGITIAPQTLFEITALNLYTGQINAIIAGSSVNIEVCEGT